MERPGPMALAAHVGFAAFGGFWGVWGASVPAVRAQAGLSDGQLGTALLFVGAGALPAMLLTGPAVDRWGHRCTALLLPAIGGAGVAVAVAGRGFVSLAIALAVLGATSGALDVAINAAAASAERTSGRPVIARAHGVFSASVVVASLGTGALRAGGAALAVPFLVVAAGAGAAAVVVMSAFRKERTGPGRGVGLRRPVASPRRAGRRDLRLPALLVVGGLAAAAFAVENAHQTWSAVYLGDVFSAGPAWAAAGPAVFAAVVAATRFAVAPLTRVDATVIVVLGAAVAAAGTGIEATAPNATVALAGLGLAAAGTAVLYPTLLRVAAAQVDEAVRGTATSVVTTVAYLGFVAGPVYVGRWSSATGLTGAMVAVAALAAALAVIAWPVLRGIAPPPGGHRPQSTARSAPTRVAPPSR